VSGLHFFIELEKAVLNYAERGSGTLSGRGVALRREKRMDVALVCAPRSALSGLMTALFNHTLTCTQYNGRRRKTGKGNHWLSAASLPLCGVLHFLTVLSVQISSVVEF